MGAVLASVAAGLAGCGPVPVGTGGETAGIRQIGPARHQAGYTLRTYVNPNYQCSLPNKGHQTFVIATKDGTPAGRPTPLWVYLHGGGIGYFDAKGLPQPPDSVSKMDQESGEDLGEPFSRGGLIGRARSSGFRGLAVSMCNRDIYAGLEGPDPNNRNIDGTQRTTNGLLATKAAVRFTTDLYSTDDVFLAGSSAGGAGVLHVGWGLQEQGMAPAGIISDAGVLNADYELADPPQCGPHDNAAQAILQERLGPIGEVEDSVHRLVRREELRVPILHVWSHGDPLVCQSGGGGLTPIDCPVDGTTVRLGAADCLHAPLHRALVDEPSRRSLSMGLCVDFRPGGPDCEAHGTMNSDDAENTDPDWPKDPIPVMWDWVRQRRLDD